MTVGERRGLPCYIVSSVAEQKLLSARDALFRWVTCHVTSAERPSGRFISRSSSNLVSLRGQGKTTEDTLFDAIMQEPMGERFVSRDAFLRTPPLGMPLRNPLLVAPSPRSPPIDAAFARSLAETLHYTQLPGPRPMLVAPQSALHHQATNDNAWFLGEEDRTSSPVTFWRTDTPMITRFTPSPFSQTPPVATHEHASVSLLLDHHRGAPILGSLEQRNVDNHHAFQMPNRHGTRAGGSILDWHHRYLTENDPLSRTVQQLLRINDEMAPHLDKMTLGELINLHSFYIAVEKEVLAWLYPPSTRIVNGNVSTKVLHVTIASDSNSFLSPCAFHETAKS